jgi:hypothetical protein
LIPVEYWEELKIFHVFGDSPLDDYLMMMIGFAILIIELQTQLLLTKPSETFQSVL